MIIKPILFLLLFKLFDQLIILKNVIKNIIFYYEKNLKNRFKT